MKKTLTRNSVAFIMTISLSLLAACGGGGGSGSNDATYDGILTQSNLPTTADASQWFKDVLLISQGFTSGSSFSIQAANGLNGSKKSTFSQRFSAAKKLPQADQTTTACPNGGTIQETVTVDQAALKITYNDTYTECTFSNGDKVNGVLISAYTDPSFTGDVLTGWMKSFETFKNLAIQTGNENFVLNGTRDSTKTYIYPGTISSTKIASINNIVMKDNINNRKVYFFNFEIDDINDYDKQEFGYKLSGAIYDSRFGSAIINSEPLKFTDGKYFPTSGAFGLSFANGTLRGYPSNVTPGDLLDIRISKYNPQTMKDEAITGKLDANMQITSSTQVPTAVITAPSTFVITPGVLPFLHADAFSSADSVGDLLSYEWKVYLANAPETVLETGNSAEFWYSLPAAGTYVLELVATDLAGNKSTAITQQVEVTSP